MLLNLPEPPPRNGHHLNERCCLSSTLRYVSFTSYHLWNQGVLNCMLGRLQLVMQLSLPKYLHQNLPTGCQLPRRAPWRKNWSLFLAKLNHLCTWHKAQHCGGTTRASMTLSQKVIRRVDPKWERFRDTITNLFHLYFPFYLCTRVIDGKHPCLSESKR